MCLIPACGLHCPFLCIIIFGCGWRFDVAVVQLAYAAATAWRHPAPCIMLRLLCLYF